MTITSPALNQLINQGATISNNYKMFATFIIVIISLGVILGLGLGLGLKDDEPSHEKAKKHIHNSNGVPNAHKANRQGYKIKHILHISYT